MNQAHGWSYSAFRAFAISKLAAAGNIK